MNLEAVSHTKADPESFFIARIEQQEKEDARVLRALTDQIELSTGGKHLVVEKVANLRSLFNWFDSNRKELALKYSGEFALLNAFAVTATFATESDAYDQGVIRFGLGNFLVQKCVDPPEVQYYGSRAIFG